MGFEKIRNNLGRIYLIDSSTISLCLSRFRWADRNLFQMDQAKPVCKAYVRIQQTGCTKSVIHSTDHLLSANDHQANFRIQ